MDLPHTTKASWRGTRAAGRASLLLAVVLLAACASPPPAPMETEPEPERSPVDLELTLNLPVQAAGCEAPVKEDRTFLERGVETLTNGDYIEAVQYFQRYRRLESSATAQWEAELAIAYASMLPNSPFYDVDAVREAYADLQAREPAGQKHHSIVLMQQALETFVIMERHVDELESRSNMLQEDLNKREQALKRLRELTLGQRESAP
ncbi:MAG: hypothetical protein ACI87W_001325 [Halieaceae bacterium]|jgi:hypothetical protein